MAETSLLEALLITAAAFNIYPLIVLIIAITGPHSQFEKNERLRARLMEREGEK